MTKRDFELIASAVMEARVGSYRSDLSNAIFETAIDEAARKLSRALASTNPRFDRERFLEACGTRS